jgi:hypothetical protein
MTRAPLTPEHRTKIAASMRLDARATHEQKREQLRSLWRDGISISQIGLILGWTRNQVSGHASRMALPRRPSPLPAHVQSTRLVTLEMEPRIDALRLTGMPWRDIAAHLGMPTKHGTIRAHMCHRDRREAPVPTVVAAPSRSERVSLGALPLPAGHAVTWGAITAGTALEGARWPG